MNIENNKINCHSRVFLSGISTTFSPLAGEGACVSTGEALNKNAFRAPLRSGFTLLELIITVVIIAILATIAVSAYQKAVLKSRFGSLMPLAKALTSANEEFYLRNGRYAANVTDLDVTSGGTTRAQITMGNESNHKYVLLTRDDMNNQLRMYQKHSPNFSGETHCEALIDNEQANWLCRDSLKGTLVGNKFGYTVYSLSEETVGSLGRTYYGKTDWNGSKPYTISDGDECLGNEIYSCRKGTLTQAICTAVGTYACRDSTFKEDSECVATSSTKYSCDGTFDHSTCTDYKGGNCGGTFRNYSKCIGEESSCGGHYEDHSQCIAKGGCANSSYDNYSSSEGGGYGSSYSNHSVCHATGYWTCADYNGKRSNYTQYSSCEGSVGTSCFNGNYTNHSVCYANAKSTCYGNTYDDTSYCEGTYCPAGARAENGQCWDGSGGTQACASAS